MNVVLFLYMCPNLTHNFYFLRNLELELAKEETETVAEEQVEEVEAEKAEDEALNGTCSSLGPLCGADGYIA